MKSRFTIVMITVGGMFGLWLVALLTNGVHEGIANAQRARFGAPKRTPALVPEEEAPAYAASENPAPAFSDHSQAQTLGAPRNAWTINGQTLANASQPPRGLSVSSSLPIVVAIKDGPQLSGDTVDLAAFDFKTIFGVVSIPVDTIIGLRMADEPRQPATICLSNGDSLTGTLITDSVTIKTTWGGATIGRDQIVSIVTTSEPVTWQQHEGRWKAVVAEPTISEPEVEAADKGNDAREAADQPPVLGSGTAPQPFAASPLQPAPAPAVNSEN